MSSDVRIDELFDFGDLFGDEGETFLEVTQKDRGGGIAAVGVGDLAGDELLAAIVERTQIVAGSIDREEFARRTLVGKGDEHGGVDAVGFGQFSLGAGELADAQGLKSADGNTRFLESANESSFVTSSGLTDDVPGGGVGSVLELFDETGVSGGLVGDGGGFEAVTSEIEGGLGDIDSKIMNGWSVHDRGDLGMFFIY